MKAHEFKNFREKMTLAVLKYTAYTFNILVVGGVLWICYTYLFFIMESM